MIHRNILRYANGRYLWWALALTAASIALFCTQGPLKGWNGGTWQGYVLGTVGALLIVWLALLGIRKRRYASSLGSVQGWTSAHVYLGTALVAVATLHCAAQFGWNVHTLAYILMCVVVASGFVGIHAYLSHPSSIVETRQGNARAQLIGELSNLNLQATELVRKCDPSIAIAVKSCIERTVIGGGVLTQLSGRDRSWFMRGASEAAAGPKLVANADQQAIIDYVANRIPRVEKRAEAAVLQSLVAALCRRQAVLRRLRRDIRLQGWLKVWLYVHVPLTIALLAALVVHILTTYLYW